MQPLYPQNSLRPNEDENYSVAGFYFDASRFARPGSRTMGSGTTTIYDVKIDCQLSSWCLTLFR